MLKLWALENFCWKVWENDFFIRVTNNYRNWLPTNLIFYSIDIRLTNIRRLYIYRIINSQEEYCIRISYRFQMNLQVAFLFAQEIGKFFALTALDLLNWITQWRHNIQILNISAVDFERCSSSVYPLKIPKSRETVPLNVVQTISPLRAFHRDISQFMCEIPAAAELKLSPWVTF